MPLRRSLIRSSLTVLVSLTGSVSQAVDLNPKGLGEVLIYPYYTTTGDYDSYINLVNTSNEFKALKVRFRESMNGAVVLQFNLYLSPQDHWSAVVYRSTENDGVILRTADKSCTVPLTISEGDIVPLHNENYQNDSMNGLERTREGFVEVIEMATINNATQDWRGDILHVNGVPQDCDDLARSWGSGGVWSLNPDDGASEPTGGLYGYGVLVDVYEGTTGIYDAVAIDNFDAPLSPAVQTAPDSPLPSLASGDTEYTLLVDGQYVSGSADSGIDAVSAVLMQARLMNDYILEPAVAAATDWVVTFPTKHEYINDDAARAPFLTAWNPTHSFACEPMYFLYLDREEARPVDPPSEPPPSLPQPRQGLCAQANVFSIQPEPAKRSIFEASAERNGHEFVLESGFYNGWGVMGFDFQSPPLSAGSLTLSGLPVVGFSLHRFSNGRLVVGGQPVLSNYVGVVAHKGEVRVDEE